MKKLTLGKLKAKAQKIFNKYIRLRDAKDNYFVCISCGQSKPLTQMQAGHYYAVKGYDSLRYNENNVNGECAGCNCFDQSHLIGYTINLEKKIGKDALQDLHDQAMEYKKGFFKWDRFELENIIVTYTAKIKELE